MVLAGKVAVVPLTQRHWPAVREIYALGIATGHATFESRPPTWIEFDATRLADHRYVALHDSEILGWVAASSVSERSVYVGIVEHSIYVHPGATGRGIGRLLLDALITSTEKSGIWTIQAGIFPENHASLKLHQRVGFRQVGVRHRLGRMSYGPRDGQWRDVIMVERRSSTVGRCDFPSGTDHYPGPIPPPPAS